MAHSQLRTFLSAMSFKKPPGAKREAGGEKSLPSRRRVELCARAVSCAFEVLRFHCLNICALGIGSAGGFWLDGDEVTSVPAICSSGRAGIGGARVALVPPPSPVISGQKSSPRHAEPLF